MWSGPPDEATGSGKVPGANGTGASGGIVEQLAAGLGAFDTGPANRRSAPLAKR